MRIGDVVVFPMDNPRPLLVGMITGLEVFPQRGRESSLQCTLTPLNLTDPAVSITDTAGTGTEPLRLSVFISPINRTRVVAVGNAGEQLAVLHGPRYAYQLDRPFHRIDLPPGVITPSVPIQTLPTWVDIKRRLISHIFSNCPTLAFARRYGLSRPFTERWQISYYDDLGSGHRTMNFDRWQGLTPEAAMADFDLFLSNLNDIAGGFSPGRFYHWIQTVSRESVLRPRTIFTTGTNPTSSETLRRIQESVFEFDQAVAYMGSSAKPRTFRKGGRYKVEGEESEVIIAGFSGKYAVLQGGRLIEKTRLKPVNQ